MKKWFTITIIVILTVVLVAISNSLKLPAFISDNAKLYKLNGYEVYVDSQAGVQIVYFKKDRQLVYHFEQENVPTFRKLAEQLSLEAAINGGYFTGNYTDAKHAGLLMEKGVVKVPLAKGDRQVTHVAEINSQNEIRFVANDDFVSADQYLAFQSGPLILNQSEIQYELIDKSVNGSGLYRRAVLGTTNEYNFMVITFKPYELSELANFIKEVQAFKDQSISAINMDGGRSTAMYVKGRPELNYNSSWFLPIIIGIK